MKRLDSPLERRTYVEEGSEEILYNQDTLRLNLHVNQVSSVSSS